MARESTITAEQVHAIADAIRAEGGKPTSRAVRERLGNTGSMGTVNRLLQQWKASHERRSTSALVLPTALQNAVLDFMEQELAAARSALETELSEQQQEAVDLAAENERQTEIIDRMSEQIADLGDLRSAAEGKAQQLALDLDAAHSEANTERQAAEHARTELAKALLRLEAMPRLEADLDAARAEAASERAGRIEAERTAAVLSSQKDDLQSRLGASAAALDVQRRELADSKAGAENELARVRTESADRITELRAELTRVLEDAKLAREQAAAALIQSRSEGRSELSRALEMVEQHQKTISTLNEALSTATAEARRSAEEAAELRGRHADTTGQQEKSTKVNRSGKT